MLAAYTGTVPHPLGEGPRQLPCAGLHSASGAAVNGNYSGVNLELLEMTRTMRRPSTGFDSLTSWVKLHEVMNM
jgi:hypothetical protein